MSAIEVLFEQVKGLELMKGSKLYTEHSKRLHEALEEALLALEKQEKLIKYLKEEHKNELKQMDEQINVIEFKLNKAQFPEQDIYFGVVLKSLQLQKKNWINKYNEIMEVLK